MGIHHSMNKDQVDEVLTEFEATTSAIKGIEQKISRVQGYVKTAEEQRETMSRQAEQATALIDSMTGSMNTKTEDVLDYFTETLDFFADLMESLETTIADLQLMNAPRELQRELGPLLVPAVVLVVIITVSNCVFGFLLAADEAAAGKITWDMLIGGVNDGTEEDVEAEGMNILKLFAIFHVVLIAIAVIYLVFEGLRRHYTSRKAKKALKLQREEEERLYEEMEREDRLALEELAYEEDAEDEAASHSAEIPEDRFGHHASDEFADEDLDERSSSAKASNQRVARQAKPSDGDNSVSPALSPLSSKPGSILPLNIARGIGAAASVIKPKGRDQADTPEARSTSRSPKSAHSKAEDVEDAVSADEPAQNKEDPTSPTSDSQSRQQGVGGRQPLLQQSNQVVSQEETKADPVAPRVHVCLSPRLIHSELEDRSEDRRMDDLLPSEFNQYEEDSSAMNDDGTQPSSSPAKSITSPTLRRSFSGGDTRGYAARQSSQSSMSGEGEVNASGGVSTRFRQRTRENSMSFSSAGSRGDAPRQNAKISMSKMPKIQISSVLRKIKQKTAHVTEKQGPARTPGTLAPVNEDLNEDRQFESSPSRDGQSPRPALGSNQMLPRKTRSERASG